MTVGASAERPVLYWDGDCGFCRRWVERWRQTTGDSVDYRTFETASADVITAAGGDPPQRIVLAQPDGTLTAGAAAALGALAGNSRTARWLLLAFNNFPLFGRTAEGVYRRVAAHRNFCAGLTNLLWGAHTQKPSYEISGWVFPRLAGLVFFAAFLSLWSQIDGLAGSQGILPVAEHMDNVRRHFATQGAPWHAWWQMPSLLWLGSSDTMLHVWLGVGTAASLLLALGILPAAAAFVAWLCYLSFVSTVPVFLNFQWDALLLETGLLLVFYVPWRARLRFGCSAPSRAGRLLAWWLVFRLMFESGIVKLQGFDASGVNAWIEGTALDYHYFTQPIPIWTSWWLARLPHWVQAASLVAVFVIELVAPFFIAGPRRLRMTAFWSFVLLMLLILASGNYGFFNILTIALCTTLVDDTSWPAAVRRRLDAVVPRRPALPRVQRMLLPWFAAIAVILTTTQLLVVLRILPPAAAFPITGITAPLRSTNSYGLFSVMTTERPEITIETSTDGVTWTPCRFRYKMDASTDRMPCFLPHMPRLDWQMWFAALQMRASGQPPGWFVPFLARLQEGSPAVRDLLAPCETTSTNPEFFRVRLDLLTFASPTTRKQSGRLWDAEPLPAYTLEGRLSPAP